MAPAHRIVGTMAALALAPLAGADVPQALDHVPADAVMIAAVPSLSALQDNLTLLQDSFGMQLDPGPAQFAAMLLETPGLNLGGSGAMALLGGPDADEHQRALAIVPVADYAAFVAALGGEAANGTSPVVIDGEPGFVRPLGAGFAALSPNEALLAALGAGGQQAAHARRLGTAGQAIASHADVLLIANLEALEPQLRQGFLAGFQAQMQMVAAMAGPDAAGQLASVQQLVEAVIRDGQTATIGLSASDAGFAFDLGAQFKPGSEFAGYCDAGGDTATLMARVPDQPFYLAWALDQSTPGMQQLRRKLTAINAAQPGMQSLFANVYRSAGIMGVSSGGMMGGGLLLKTVLYLPTENPEAFTDTFQASVQALQGQQTAMYSLEARYEPGASQLADEAVDHWAVRMKVDPANPMAPQMQMPLTMIFGPAMGPSGYLARADQGVVLTFGRDLSQLQAALNAARRGDGLGARPAVQRVAEHLPSRRNLEAYVSVKDLADAILPMAAMFGNVPIDVAVPPDLAPIGIGATCGDGGTRLRVFVPAEVVKLFREIGAAFEQAQEQMIEEAPPEGGRRPRF